MGAMSEIRTIKNSISKLPPENLSQLMSLLNAKHFGFVQCLETHPRRKLHAQLSSQGMQANQQITFLSDGADNLRELQLNLYPESLHVLDWFHITSG
ncbi:hypothetical protein LY16_02911 [Xenorhabdus doucetiae]|uniref:Transposase n=1 Tax=Xenorhabdus doucetiae TaxID=351671 RepID=A0ABY3NNL7_9GAMM|nr:hypothetical protein LY16_02911 [Xenorhabdus doucetiae]